MLPFKTVDGQVRTALDGDIDCWRKQCCLIPGDLSKTQVLHFLLLTPLGPEVAERLFRGCSERVREPQLYKMKRHVT